MAGEADVALRIAGQVDDGRLISRKLTEFTASLCASRGYAERHGLPASPSELAGHAFVVFEKSPISTSINLGLLDRIQPAQIASRCTDMESLIAAVLAGIGIGPIPSMLGEANGELVRCFDPPEGTSVWTWLVISPEASRRPEVKAFVRYFAPRFRAVFGPAR